MSTTSPHPPSPLPRSLVRLLAGLGIAADATMFVVKAPDPVDAGLYAFLLWLVLPWFVALLLAWRVRAPGLLAGTVLAAAFEALAFYAAFVAPQGSTAALVYAVKPLWQLGLIGVCMVGGALTARRRNEQGH